MERCSFVRLHSFLVLRQVIAKVANSSLLSSRVLPALVTLANDPEMSVRVATVPALGVIIETSDDNTVSAKAINASAEVNYRT